MGRDREEERQGSMSTAVTIIQWAPCLLLEGQPTACGITTSYSERLPALYDTSAQAMAAAETAIHQRPDAIGYSAKRVEVQQ